MTTLATPLDPPREATGRRGLTRRDLLRKALGGGLFGAAGCGLVGSYARYVEPFWPVTERLQMDFPGVGPSLNGLRVAQLSDLHVAKIMPLDFLRKQLEYVQRLEPDILVLTGDFVTHPNGRTLDDLAGLAPLLQARLGVFAVLGNHEYSIFGPDTSMQSEWLADRISDLLADHGVRVLRNEAEVLEIGDDRLQIVGLEEFWSRRFDPVAAFANVDPKLPCLALVHNPDAIKALAVTPAHWILAGHTHGGQVRIPFFGAPRLPIRHRQYDAGLFHVEGKRLYVNRGLGYIRQVRFNCRPEITLFTLTPRATGPAPHG